MIPVDEVTVGLVVDAIAAVGRQLSTQIQARGGKHVRAAVELASFFDTYELLDRAIPPDDGDVLKKKLRGSEVQALIQELLAVRLSDGPELLAQEIRQRFLKILVSPSAEQVFEEVDRQIEILVVQVSTAQPQILNQIREEAHFTRINATLEAINRHLTAMDTPHDPAAEQEFWERYRHHVAAHHGMIEPPDFARRRRVPIADIYVAPAITEEMSIGEKEFVKRDVDFWGDKAIDRTVLLGSPGGGKTTASNVLLHQYARRRDLGTPFLVTLREFGASDPPEWSVVEYLEQRLRKFYQCTPPEGAINRLLLAGGAFIVFDGLDELIDTSRRAEMSAIIEQFSIEYPLSKILVTSRIVGYEEARLDTRQFKILTIGDFSEELVAEYIHKWFSQEPDMPAEDASRLADGLIQESSSIQDLRSNPLMLSLICILYRGERSIPQSRSDVYEKCADLLFRKWDTHRKIYVELRARHLIEPAIRYLAYWMLTRQDTTAAVSRRQLIAESVNYFRSRGFDENNDPAAAAEEFVDFCGGRAWVFSEVGTTAQGEQLYTFTHRTFMEYFAACYLASVNEVPERLARTLAPKVSRGEWDVVGQLAVQIKDRNVERGAERIFVTLIDERRKRSPQNRLNVLSFLARCMEMVQPRPSIAKKLTAAILDIFPEVSDSSRFLPRGTSALNILIRNSHESASGVAEALNEKIPEFISSSNQDMFATGIELGCCMHILFELQGSDNGSSANREFWQAFTDQNLLRYREQIINAARATTSLRNGSILWVAYQNSLLSADEVVSICASVGWNPLFSIYWYETLGFGRSPDIAVQMDAVLSGNVDDLRLVSALGSYLISSDEVPEVHSSLDYDFSYWLRTKVDQDITSPPISFRDATSNDEMAYLGLLFCVALAVESSANKGIEKMTTSRIIRKLGTIKEFAFYVASRLGEFDGKLPPLEVNSYYSAFFDEWARGEIGILR